MDTGREVWYIIYITFNLAKDAVAETAAGTSYMFVRQIPPVGEGANPYLLISGDEAALVDPSVPHEDVIPLLGEARVKYILLTHGHFDHLLYLSEAKKEFSAPVLIQGGDADCLSDPVKSLFLPFFGKRTTFDPADGILRDGDELVLGKETVRVMHTPGHTPGSVCFLCDTFVLTGDTLFDMSVGRTDFPGGDPATLKKSLSALSKLDPSLTLYPGHGPATTLERQIRLNPYMNGEW